MASLAEKNLLTFVARLVSGTTCKLSSFFKITKNCITKYFFLFFQAYLDDQNLTRASESFSNTCSFLKNENVQLSQTVCIAKSLVSIVHDHYKTLISELPIPCPPSPELDHNPSELVYNPQDLQASTTEGTRPYRHPKKKYPRETRVSIKKRKKSVKKKIGPKSQAQINNDEPIDNVVVIEANEECE